jgi:hypothetical protein
VTQNWAGAGWGGQIIPRIGMEVMVMYLDSHKTSGVRRLDKAFAKLWREALQKPGLFLAQLNDAL